MGVSRFSEAQQRRMETLYLQEEMSMSQIGARFDCTQPGVAYILKRRGVPIRPRGGKKRQTPRRLEFLENPDKQLVRNTIVHSVRKAFPPEKTGALRALTLPGDALRSPESVERQLLATYDQLELICLEKDTHQYEEILDQMDELEHKSISLHHRTVEKYLQTSRSYYDFVWLDLCGGGTEKQVRIWTSLFRDWQMGEPSVFALTLNESPRLQICMDSSDILSVIGAELREAGYQFRSFMSIGYDSRRYPMRASIYEIRPA